MLGRLSKKLDLNKAAHFLIRKHPKWSIAALFLVFVLIIILGYLFKWDWTGLTDHVGPNTQQYQPRKTLWDWLNLLGVLGIPVAVAFGSLWFTAQQSKTQDAENIDNQHEEALQGYIDKMSELLLEKNLRKSEPEEEVRTIARARTWTVLTRLDGKRKGIVLEFLYASYLIYTEDPVIFLGGTDLAKADLSYTNLQNANLRGVNLRGADLSSASLDYIHLNYADLSGANLKRAYLNHADLSDADLTGANLTSIFNVTPEQVAQAKSLKGTTMPDRSSIENPGDSFSFASRVLDIWRKEGRLP